VVAEAAVFFACGEVSDAELGQVVLNAGEEPTVRDGLETVVPS
jgi:hypothetical protein